MSLSSLHSVQALLFSYSSSIFSKDELSINPTCNVMALTHRLATTDEMSLLNEIDITIDKLPILLMKDVQRRWYDFGHNQVVAIERGPDNVYFRIVS